MNSSWHNKTIGDFSYDTNRLLGEGYSAKVYLGTKCLILGSDNRSGQPVAVKVIEQSGIDNEL